MNTPLMQQYLGIKEKCRDSILLFRLGDFYEMFYEDAEIASKLLGITLTSRDREKNIPMAGVPFHAANNYISKLVSAGYKVSMCEQVGEIDGKIVRREITKTITPGTFSDPDFLEDKSNQYIVSFCAGVKGAAIAKMDITTGEFRVCEYVSLKDAINNLFKISPKEILLVVKDNSLKQDVVKYAKLKNVAIQEYKVDNPETVLTSFFNLSLEELKLVNKKYAIYSAGALLKYVSNLQNCGAINRVIYDENNSLNIDFGSQENLDILSKKASLFNIIDKTKSAMGGRFLKSNLISPLVDKQKILKRHLDIEYFINHPIQRSDISNILRNILDFERSFNRVLNKEANVRDLNVIKKSFFHILKLFTIEPKYFSVSEDKVLNLYELLEGAILDTNTLSIKEGGIINPEFNDELNKLHKISTTGKDYILDLENRERIKSGIKNLRISYNKIFGYYIEITKSNLASVPKDYIRRQTLANGERYITEELKNYEEQVLTAKDKMASLEFDIFNQILDVLSEHFDLFNNLAENISYLDFVVAMSELAIEHKYFKPIIKEDGPLILKGSRHPIVERLVDKFVSNDLTLNEHNIIILTGPNMSGKSTFMKQIALIVVLAQIGSFVPADYAEIPLFDKIFTRVGANDDISAGESTFMVEMNEVSNIISNATEKSLVILDEVGRGTSTYDGISIATAVTEYIHDNIKAKTIFATHYHELNELEKRLSNVSNYRVEVEELIDRVVFLNKIVPGNADKSYGIEVARLAGLPKELIQRAKDILRTFMTNKESDIFDEKLEQTIIQDLKSINLNELSPIELYKLVSDIQKKI